MRHGDYRRIEPKTGSSLHQIFGNLLFAREPYDRLFPASSQSPLPNRPTDPTVVKLKAIADARGSTIDAPLTTSSGDDIPAGYTYFGQFVIHDLSRRERDPESGASISRATPALDLDSIYGDGASMCPYLYQPPRERSDSGCLFYMGRTGGPRNKDNKLPGGRPLDLPRLQGDSKGISVDGSASCVAPLVADPRNDENLITSQLQTLFMSVHNRVAKVFLAEGKSGEQSFGDARRFVLLCYRRIVVHDYLMRLLPKAFYDDILSPSPDLIPAEPGPIPREFVFAAGRVGHAMNRQRYTINRHVDSTDSTLTQLLRFSSFAEDPPLPVPADWVLQWENFFKLTDAIPPQSARRLTPMLAMPLVNHRTGVPNDAPYDTVSFRDLWRNYAEQLPTGQECASILADRLRGKVDVPVLSGDQIQLSSALQRHHFAEKLAAAIDAHPQFKTETPLSYYLAQEAASQENGTRFGPLGAYIVATTFRRALTARITGMDLAQFSAVSALRPQSGMVSSMPEFIALLTCSLTALQAAIKTASQV